jgi:hypothetical protein
VKTPIYRVGIRARLGEGHSRSPTDTVFYRVFISFRLRVLNFLPIKEFIGNAPAGCATGEFLHGLVVT